MNRESLDIGRIERPVPHGSVGWIMGCERRHARDIYTTTGCRVESLPKNEDTIVLKGSTESIELGWNQIQPRIRQSQIPHASPNSDLLQSSGAKWWPAVKLESI
jgi:hypothetical protein